MGSLPSRLCVFIDGLDEFQGTHADLIDFVQAVSKSSNIKLCVSSRPWPEFRQAFEASPKLHVHELTPEDISRYAREVLGRDSHYQRLHAQSPAEAGGLVNELISMAQGVFLWVYLAVRDLLRGLQYDDDISTLRQRLKALPKDLEDYFERMLQNIDAVYYHETSVFFSILANTECSLDTLITWAYRDSRNIPRKLASFALDSPTSLSVDSSAFTRKARELTRDADASESESEGTRTQLNILSYSPKRKQARLRARCKDLVHIADEESSNHFTFTMFSITFLHRTVADFFQLPRIKNIIANRIASGSQTNKPSLPLVALAEVYLELLWVERRNPACDIDTTGMIITAMAREVRKSSEWDYLCLVHKLCTLAHDMHFVGFTNGVRLSIWKVAIERWGLRDDGSADDHDVFRQSEHHRTRERLDFPLHSPSQKNFNALFWTAHCRECFELMDLESFGESLLIAMSGTRAALPDLATGEEMPSDAQERPLANLTLVRDLMNTRVWKDEVTRGAAWIKFLNKIRSISAWPPNLIDGIRIMIQHGAPPWTPEEGLEGYSHHVFTSTDRTEKTLNSAYLLGQIPAIAEHEPGTLRKDFMERSRVMKQSASLLTSVRSLLGW